MKTTSCCNHDCCQGRECAPAQSPELDGPDAFEIVLWGAILALLVAPFVA